MRTYEKLTMLEPYAEAYFSENGWPELGSFDCLDDDIYAVNYFEYLYSLYTKGKFMINSEVLKKAMIDHQKMIQAAKEAKKAEANKKQRCFASIATDIKKGVFLKKFQELKKFVRHAGYIPEAGEFTFSDGTTSDYFIKGLSHSKAYFDKRPELSVAYGLKQKLLKAV